MPTPTPHDTELLSALEASPFAALFAPLGAREGAMSPAVRLEVSGQRRRAQAARVEALSAAEITRKPLVGVGLGGR